MVHHINAYASKHLINQMTSKNTRKNDTTSFVVCTVYARVCPPNLIKHYIYVLTNNRFVTNL